MVTALYPGTFDPVTMGHLNVAQRAARLFDSLIVAVYDTPSKSLLFNTEERVGLMREAVADMPNVTVRRSTVWWSTPPGTPARPPSSGASAAARTSSTSPRCFS